MNSVCIKKQGGEDFDRQLFNFWLLKMAQEKAIPTIIFSSCQELFE